MTKSKLLHLTGALFLFAAGCAGEVGAPTTGGPAPGGEPSGPVAPALTGDWDESRASTVDPCGGASLDTCGAATHGACGVVAMPDADQCLPLFKWGVTADGRVELGSSQRLFTIPDLVAQPLSTVEQGEAAQMADFFATAVTADELGDQVTEVGLDPLASISHYGVCTTGTGCLGSSTMITMFSHYNTWVGSTYRHIHLNGYYWNNSSPWYYCNNRGSFYATYTDYCGTP